MARNARLGDEELMEESRRDLLGNADAAGRFPERPGTIGTLRFGEITVGQLPDPLDPTGETGKPGNTAGGPASAPRRSAPASAARRAFRPDTASRAFRRPSRREFPRPEPFRGSIAAPGGPGARAGGGRDRWRREPRLIVCKAGRCGAGRRPGAAASPAHSARSAWISGRTGECPRPAGH